MRQAYAHEAVVTFTGGAGDEEALDGAITAALRGEPDRDPPSSTVAHHTAATRDGAGLRLRILFAAAPNNVDEVRDRIDAALATGHFTGPDGVTTEWHAVSSGCTRIGPDDRAPARGLLRPRPAG
jgi:hypothetical protein